VNSHTFSLSNSLCEVSDSISLKFNDSGEKLVLGSSLGVIRLVDMSKDAIITCFPNNITNAYCLDCHSHLIVSGHDEGRILLWDERHNQAPLSVIKGHAALCCAVSWKRTDDSHFASGSDDASCRIWDIRKLDKAVTVFEEHKAAVRAISWSAKNQDRIVTGGGTQDRHIKVWDWQSGKVILDASSGSQICNLFWNDEFKEIISTEGFHDCTITIWRENDLKASGSISGHQDRVIYAAASSDQRNLVTLTPKDGLQFWSLFKNQDLATKAAQLR
jgi:WD40 repeat protein